MSACACGGNCINLIVSRTSEKSATPCALCEHGPGLTAVKDTDKWTIVCNGCLACSRHATEYVHPQCFDAYTHRHWTECASARAQERTSCKCIPLHSLPCIRGCGRLIRVHIEPASDAAVTARYVEFFTGPEGVGITSFAYFTMTFVWLFFSMAFPWTRGTGGAICCMTTVGAYVALAATHHFVFPRLLSHFATLVIVLFAMCAFARVIQLVTMAAWPEVNMFAAAAVMAMHYHLARQQTSYLFAHTANRMGRAYVK